MIKIIESGIVIDDLHINIPPGPIGMSITGGFDSTILSYILMKYHPGMIHFFTLADSITHRSDVIISIKVIDKIVELLGRTENFIQHVTYLDGKNAKLAAYLTDQADVFNLDVMYTGLNEAPPDLKLDLDPAIMHYRTPNIIKPSYSKNRKVYHPFINIDKRKIKKLYDIFGVADELIPVTVSCTHKNLVTPFKGVHSINIATNCNKCWWCEERKWAFGEL